MLIIAYFRQRKPVVKCIFVCHRHCGVLCWGGSSNRKCVCRALWDFEFAIQVTLLDIFGFVFGLDFGKKERFEFIFMLWNTIFSVLCIFVNILNIL